VLIAANLVRKLPRRMDFEGPCNRYSPIHSYPHTLLLDHQFKITFSYTPVSFQVRFCEHIVLHIYISIICRAHTACPTHLIPLHLIIVILDEKFRLGNFLLRNFRFLFVCLCSGLLHRNVTKCYGVIFVLIL